MIQLQDLTKTYDAGESVVHALASVTLDIADGEFVAVIGASGSGKSTMMNILGCLDQPTSGSYVLDGMRVSDLSEDDLALVRNRAIGFVFQNYNLLPRMTALRQVELPLIYRGDSHATRQQLSEDALRAVGLGERMQHKPTEMSGGQQQRVAIARALITNPSLILADEPTGNLDSRTSLEIIALFQQLNLDRGMTVVYVTHEPDIAQHAGRILQMRDGSIVSDVRNEDRLWAPDELRKLGPGLADLPAQGQVPPSPATRPPAKPRLAPTG
jgi:putative ABC transport system ATP-binding protein